jgi:hypothetical protein
MTRTELQKAFDEGKTLQVYCFNHWKDFVRQNQLDSPNFEHSGIENWRIKPETNMSKLPFPGLVKEFADYLQVCNDCGSEEVARCKWVNVNTEEIYSADSGTNLEWCFNCKSETNIINKEDYEIKIQ